MSLIDAAMQGNITAVKGYTETAKLLIEKGADVNAKDEFSGMTALIWASSYGHLETVKLLIEKGAGVHARTHSGKTALTIASEKGHMDIVKILKPYSGQS